jgi:hypothetical protein
MNQDGSVGYEGGCTCGQVRYRLNRSPMVVHCCHCRWCQRETGAAFALNAMIETSNISLLSGKPEKIKIPSQSGKGQTIVRCPNCRIAVWSHYAGAGELLSFVRVGTLDNPDAVPPDIHIFTSSKQPWVVLPADTPAFEEYYRRSEQLSADCLDRLSNLAAAN